MKPHEPPSPGPPVRTTAVIPGDVWQRAKACAAYHRTSLQALIIAGLEAIVERLEDEAPAA